MAELKIKTHTTYTYETTDGREFDDHQEAEAWQSTIECMKTINMLDSNFCNTTEVDEVAYIHIKNMEQVEAFRAKQAYECISAYIPAPGYWYYDDISDSYVNVNREMDRLQSIIESLDVLGK